MNKKSEIPNPNHEKMTDLKTLDSEASKMIAKYDQKKAATLPLLHLAQEHVGYVTPEVEQWVSDWTEVPVVHIREVVTFYSMYHRMPVGKTHIRFCATTSCVLNGGEELLKYLKDKLGIENGGCTKDRKFSLEEAECLCACDQAPMMQFGDKYYGDLTPKKIDDLLANN